MTPRWLAVVGRKGGTGKTALAVGLAVRYARAGRRVLLVDMDPQGSASLVLGADAAGGHLADVLRGEAPPETVPHPGRCAELWLDVLPGGPELETLTGARPLRDALADLPADVVLVDCAPGHAALERLALEAADVVLACCEPHRMAIAGAARVLDETKGLPRRPRRALVLGRVDERRGLDKAAPDLLAGAFGLPVFTVHQDSTLAGALNAGNLPPAHGRAAADLEAVAAWIDRTEGKGTP